LLETAGDPIDEVRRRAGYADAAAFRRVFRQATGLSPGSYRQAYGLRAGRTADVPADASVPAQSRPARLR
jgi:AraC-like DNA-binding protein